MTNSSLVDFIRISPNKTVRKKKISKITIHHAAGVTSVETLGAIFVNPTREGSANYGIGNDGRIGLYVPEGYAAWTSGNVDNDQQAITIEVSNNINKSPWTVSDAAYSSLIALCVDICKRNNIEKINYTGDKEGSLTEHRMFQKTACPGEYLHNRMSAIAAEINNKLEEGKPLTETERKELDAVEERVAKKYNTVSDCPTWGRATVQKMIDSGYLAGDGSGLALTEDMLRIFVILDRSGSFD